MPALVKPALPTSCNLAVEQRVWLEGRVVNVHLRFTLPPSEAMANLVFEALRPVMAMSVAHEPLLLQSQYREIGGDSAYLTFAYTWQGSAVAEVWEISDAIGGAMDVRRLMAAAFGQHDRYRVTTIEGVTPDVENLSVTESRRHLIHLTYHSPDILLR